MTVAPAGVAFLRALAHAQRDLPGPSERKLIRERAGIGVQVVADTVGCSRQCIAQYETGKRSPRGDFLVRYVEALNAMREATA